MFVWNPPESIGFLFLIISKMTLMSALHPKYVKAIKGKKTDKRILNGLPTSTNLILSDVPLFLPKDFRQLRELSRYRFKLVCMKSSEKNRIQNCMTISNVVAKCSFSILLARQATEIISYLLEHTADSMDEKLSANS